MSKRVPVYLNKFELGLILEGLDLMNSDLEKGLSNKEQALYDKLMEQLKQFDEPEPLANPSRSKK